MENVQKIVELEYSLGNELISTIKNLVEEKGTETSKFQNNTKVLKVDEERSFNLGGGRWLEEVSGKELIDSNGYAYDFHVLTTLELAELTDYLDSL